MILYISSPVLQDCQIFQLKIIFVGTGLMALAPQSVTYTLQHPLKLWSILDMYVKERTHQDLRKMIHPIMRQAEILALIIDLGV